MYRILILGFLILGADCYVLLQVRKQDNNFSNIDALIHKVVPSDQFEKIASKLGRKEFSKKHAKPNALDNEKSEERSDADVENTIKKYTEDKPVFRTHEKTYNNPKVINFRSDKPSMVFEIDSKAIIKTIKNVLASDTFQTYIEKFARQAAGVYRAITEEMQKEDRK